MRTLAPNSVRSIKTRVGRFCRLKLSQARNRRLYLGRNGLKLNVGCGANVHEGWVNIDLYASSGVLFWDLRTRWPFDNDSAAEIFAEHVFEHLRHPMETQFFLGECMRCLGPGGTLRIIVPDAGKYLSLYNELGWEGLASTRPLTKNGTSYKDTWLPDSTYRTKMEFINAIFRQGGEHQYAYDAETLIMVLQDAGFSEVAQQSFGHRLDLPARKSESLYVNGRK